MPKSAQIDQYILKSADFAQDILEHMRHLVHIACPEIEETIKWAHQVLYTKERYCAAWLHLKNTVHLASGTANT